MRRIGLIAGGVALAAVAGAEPLSIANGDFETDFLADGQISTASPTGWTLAQEVGVTQAGEADPAATALASEAGDVNNVVWVFQDNATTGASYFAQTLAATLAPSTRYTLALRVADTMAGSVTPPEQGRAFPVIGDGISTGDVFANLALDASLLQVPMPGFTSAELPAPADGAWTAWTLVWETAADEEFAGMPLVVTIGQRGAGVDEEREVFFDDLTLDATAVPEASTDLASVAAVLVLATRLRRREKRRGARS